MKQKVSDLDKCPSYLLSYKTFKPIHNFITRNIFMMEKDFSRRFQRSKFWFCNNLILTKMKGGATSVNCQLGETPWNVFQTNWNILWYHKMFRTSLLPMKYWAIASSVTFNDECDYESAQHRADIRTKHFDVRNGSTLPLSLGGRR